MYGWAVERGAPIAIPLLGCFFAGFGMMMVMSSTTTVLVDANAENNMAAAAVSCSSCMRGIVGAIGGILSLPMMNAMGNGWLYTLWAAITTLGFFGVVI
ncbi:hypothetical protein BGW42_007115 [Actinomortierella wolfii]|nr:hypothetical protein BGW42_007115 [Actinomortierella wolfii]